MFLTLLLLWIGFNGKFTMEILLFGIVLSMGICYFCSKATSYSPKWEVRLLSMMPALFGYVLNLAWEVLKANWAVARIILSPKADAAPVLVEFNPRFKYEHNWVILANSITLTPGTITARMEHGELTVHCLVPEMATDIRDCSFVKRLRGMEAK